MKSLRASFVAPLFALMMSVAACSGQAPTDGTASEGNAVTQTTSAEGGASKHFARRSHGSASLISLALRDPSINLTDTQRATIEAAQKTLAPKKGSTDHAAQKTALAAAVRAGNVDALTTKPNVEVMAQKKAEKKAALSNALTVLHSTLTKDQRVALVAAAEKRHEGKKDGVAKAKHHKKHGAKAEGGKKTAFASLDLTADQKAQIEAKMKANQPAQKTEAEREAMKAKFVAMKKERSERLQTFVSDQFDVAAFLARPEGAQPKMEKPARMSKLAIIVPILTPEQREKLALEIEQGHQKNEKPAAL
jgi:Spy/CpxP family protein refolding chaperone